MNSHGNGSKEAFTLRTGITAGDMRTLGRQPLFSGLDHDDLRRMLSTSTVRHYPQDTTLFMEGEAARNFYVVLSGWVKLYRLSENGSEAVISVIPPNDSFAEAAVFDNRTYPVNAATITKSRLLVVGAEALMRELRENFTLTMNMLSSLSCHMRRNINALHQLSTMSSAERLADFLLGLCDVYEGEAHIILPMDKSLIAARLGMQPETFSRALGKLKQAGVHNSGHDVTIKNVKTLREFIKNKIPA